MKKIVALLIIVCTVFITYSRFPLLSHAQSPIRLGILGDSSEDEYRADDNREGGTPYASTTLNWTELVVNTNRFDLGQWGVRSEPRRSGYEYNWSRTGAETHDIIASGALNGMVNHIQQGDVDIVFYTIGGNDFAYYRDGADIYSGAISGASLTFKLNNIMTDMTTTVNTLLNSDPDIPIIVTTLADPGEMPSNLVNFPDPIKRQRVTDAINVVNQHIIQLTNSSSRITLLDAEALKSEIFARMDQQGNIIVGGEQIRFDSGAEPHNALVADNIHAGTVLNALYANSVITGVNFALGTSIPLFSDQEALTLAGILTASPSATLSPSNTPAVTAIPASCPSDINEDNVTDITDYSIMLLDYLKPNPANPRSDINQDSIVDISDYVLILQNFLQTCN